MKCLINSFNASTPTTTRFTLRVNTRRLGLAFARSKVRASKLGHYYSSTATSNTQPVSKPVVVSLRELQDGKIPFSTLEEAFGPLSLGIIIVNGLPSRFGELRTRLLSYSSYLANLPQNELWKLESPASKYLVGWSQGKETLKDGRYDTLKGSYYVNCAPGFEDINVQSTIRQEYPSFPEYTASNIWPPEKLLPGFEATFRTLCELIVDVAALVARSCDLYAEANIEGYVQGYLEHVVKTSVSTKARLLYYFPPASSALEVDEMGSKGEKNIVRQDEDDWCATHLDHGCLTGLTSAMYIDEAASPPFIPSSLGSSILPLLPELPAPPTPETGLYIHSRTGQVTKINIPRDGLGFQTGEALERITRGMFRAVPHFVKGIRAAESSSRVARSTLAVFTQPNLWDAVETTLGGDVKTFAEFARETVEKNHPNQV